MFDGEMEAIFADAFAPEIDAWDRSQTGRKRVAFVSSKNFAGFVKTDDWTPLIVGPLVDIKDSLNGVDEVSILFGRNLPVVGEISFEGVLNAVEQFRARSTLARIEGNEFVDKHLRNSARVTFCGFNAFDFDEVGFGTAVKFDMVVTVDFLAVDNIESTFRVAIVDLV